jgi:hypothetical protein
MLINYDPFNDAKAENWYDTHLRTVLISLCCEVKDNLFQNVLSVDVISSRAG